MVVLVDTNIIIDALANREPYADNAKKILEKCAAREVTGILAAHSIPNMFYIFRKNFSQDERRFLLKNLCNIFKISDLNCNLLEYLTQRDIQTKNSGVNVRYRGKHRFFKGFNEFIKEKTRRCDNDFEKIERHVFF